MATFKHRAFTLIELLVVISIIALLVGILLPALAAARNSATNAVCMSNQRQVAVAAIAYEADEKRLIVHLSEITGASVAEQVSHSSGGPKNDTRDLWGRYLSSVNYLGCSYQPAWDKTVKKIPLATRRIYVDYTLFAGYFDNDNNASTPYDRWTRTDDEWLYKGERAEVMFGDRMNFSNGNQLLTNHPIPDFAMDQIYPNYSSLSIASTFSKSWNMIDPLDDAVGNFTFRDGSVFTFHGDDESMYDVTSHQLYTTWRMPLVP